MDAQVTNLIDSVATTVLTVIGSAVTSYMGLLISLALLGYIVFRVKRTIGVAK